MPVSETKIREITRVAYEQLGSRATPELLKKVVQEVVRHLEVEATPQAASRTEPPGRFIVTLLGKNRPTVLSGVMEALAKCRCEIVDFSPKVVDVVGRGQTEAGDSPGRELLAIIVIADSRPSPLSFDAIREELNSVAKHLGLFIEIYPENLFH